MANMKGLWLNKIPSSEKGLNKYFYTLFINDWDFLALGNLRDQDFKFTEYFWLKNK